MIIISYNNIYKRVLSPDIAREMMSMRKTLLIALLAPLLAPLLVLLLTASVTPALAQDKTFELKLSHWVPASHPLQKALEDWGAAVEKESGGTIKYKVYPAQQLGKAFDHYDMARDGIADVTYINPGYQPGRFPIIGAGELPFLMSDAKGGSMGLDAWYRKYAEKEMEDAKFCLAFTPPPPEFRGAARRHPCSVLGAGSTRHYRTRRCRRRHLPVGIAGAVRHRQGDEISDGCAALCHDIRLCHEQGQVQPDVRPAEEGDRRQLQYRSRRSRRRTLGQIRRCRPQIGRA